jgi:hypothetical protein
MCSMWHPPKFHPVHLKRTALGAAYDIRLLAVSFLKESALPGPDPQKSASIGACSAPNRDTTVSSFF